MFEIKKNNAKELQLIGRFDASQVEKGKSIFNKISQTTILDLKDLEYISSAGLSVLLMTQKRLNQNNDELLLKNMNRHIREIFKYAGFDMIFKIE